MGRKNYESIPEKYRPLPNRTNIIVSRQKNFNAPNCLVVDSIENAIKVASEKSEAEIFIIGGAEIYAQSIDWAQKIYLTRVHHSFEADAFFPNIDLKKYKLLSRLYVQKDEKHAYAFTFYVYKKK
jgi:dihydrofolate reductase